MGIPVKGRPRVAEAFAAGHTATAASNTAVTLTKSAPGAGKYNVLEGPVYVGYSATPTGGIFSIEDGAANVVFQQPIAAAGIVEIKLPFPIRGTANTALLLKLTAGGTTVGYINAPGLRVQTGT